MGVKTLVLKDIGIFDTGIFAMKDLETLIVCGHHRSTSSVGGELLR